MRCVSSIIKHPLPIIMKTHFSSVFAKVALVAFALCLSACGKVETPIVGDPNSTITGEWICTDSPLSKFPNIDNHDLVFYKADKISFRGNNFILRSTTQDNRNGMWTVTLVNNQRILKITLPGTTDSETITTEFPISENNTSLLLSVTYNNGTAFTYYSFTRTHS